MQKNNLIPPLECLKLEKEEGTSPLKCKYIWNTKAFLLNKKCSQGCIRLTQECSNCYSDFLHMFGLAFSDIRYFPPLGQCKTKKRGGEYFEDYPTFLYKADVGGFQK